MGPSSAGATSPGFPAETSSRRCSRASSSRRSASAPFTSARFARTGRLSAGGSMTMARHRRPRASGSPRSAAGPTTPARYGRMARPSAGATTTTARRRRPKVIASPASAAAVITPALCGPMAPPCAGAPRWATSTPPTATPPLLALDSRNRPRASDLLRSAAGSLTPAGSARTGLRFAGARGSRPQPSRGRCTSASGGRPLARPGSIESPSASTPGQCRCAPISRAPDRLPSEPTGRV